MKKCAVVIGVNKTGKLPTLSAAASGARDFAAWAKSQDYDTVLLTDEGKAVSVKEIKAAIRNFVDKQAYGSMIIFFSGHGILKSALDEQWLLSDAPDDLNEAVNVQPSSMFARRSGIPHIVFISDSCRSRPDNPLLSEMLGSVIFPNIEPKDQQVDLDMFYAASPGNPAHEVATDVSFKNFKGIYTECMLEALYGKVPEVMRKIKERRKEFNAVMPYELKMYLSRAVPTAAEKISIRLSQNPHSEVTSRDPKHLSKFAIERLDAPSMELINWNSRLGHKSKELEEPLMHSSPPKSLDRLIKYNDVFDMEVKMHEELELLPLTEMILSANDLPIGDFESGFVITGLNFMDQVIPLNDFDVTLADGYFLIGLKKMSRKTHLLWKLPNGGSVPFAVLKGYVGVAVFKEDTLVNINYRPSGSNPFFPNTYIPSGLEKKRALIAAKSSHGLFRISEDKDRLISSASYLRSDKKYDPTLGLYSAYAYAQAGSMNNVASVFSYMKKESTRIPFDVAMLYEFSGIDINVDLGIISSPFCPMLSQGWSYLAVDPDRFDKELIWLNRHRVPGLWTTFTKEGTRLVEERYNQGE
ncbi:hypothetical protein QFZ20_000820 [Flavobacterium sp. W4I14]|nr:hypothetical protein [Flavobacterium sp. W4I14]